MPQLLKRLAFRVGAVPNERTNTLTSISNDGHYISLRPLIQLNTASEEEFPFEWVFAGTSKDIKVTHVKQGVVKQDFNFWLDTNRYLNVPNSHCGEINTVWTEWDSGSLAENGQVFPTGKGNPGVPFFELWHPLDPNRSDYVLLSGKKEIDLAAKAKSVVFKVVEGQGYDGMVIVTGNWAQGFLSKHDDGTVNGLNFLRTLTKYDGSKEAFVLYGPDAEKFPQEYSGFKVGDHAVLDGLKWEVIESS
ncbi:HRI1 (YLR301W) [Zygosaccharomyces parabailii]|nr:HRI1 (YLR301W) [Zygosaccharomyces parabailii]